MPNDDEVLFKSPTSGKIAPVAEEDWADFLSKGYVPQSHKVMYDTEGKRAMIPNAELRDRMKSGWQTTPETDIERKHREAGGVTGALKGMIPPPPGGNAPVLSKEFWFGKEAPGIDINRPGTFKSDITRPLPADLPTAALTDAPSPSRPTQTTLGNAIYRGASLFSPMSPEAAEASSAVGDTSGVVTQAAVPAALTVAGPLLGRVNVPFVNRAALAEGITPEGLLRGGRGAPSGTGITALDVAHAVVHPKTGLFKIGQKLIGESTPEVRQYPFSKVSESPGPYRGPEQVERAQAEATKQQAKADTTQSKADEAARKAVPVSQSPGPYRGPKSARGNQMAEAPKSTIVTPEEASKPTDLISRTKRLIRPGEAPTAQDLKAAGDRTQIPTEDVLNADGNVVRWGLKTLARFGDELAKNELVRRQRLGR